MVELSQTQGQPFRIVNENKPVAWLISPQHMYELNLMISLILQKDAGLADTLAILANDEIQQQLEESTTDIEAGKGTPLESLLE
ncbi:hypothetical protein [Candidatus Leptofilum sp.]|uniref:hypothetical protein n=1 Tax=Candidatus Leptofilum sp. TaxID=3241576 RepID=UPI003B5CDFAE